MNETRERAAMKKDKNQHIQVFVRVRWVSLFSKLQFDPVCFFTIPTRLYKQMSKIFEFLTIGEPFIKNFVNADRRIMRKRRVNQRLSWTSRLAKRWLYAKDRRTNLQRNLRSIEFSDLPRNRYRLLAERTKKTFFKRLQRCKFF